MLLTERLALVASLQFGIGSRYDCHVYAIRSADRVVLIDAGSGFDTDALLAEIWRHWPGVTIDTIMLTHTHPDHACGAHALYQRTGCRVYAPPQSIAAVRTGDAAATGLADAHAIGMYPVEIQLRPLPEAVAYGGSVEACGTSFTPIHVRGHAADAHCILAEFEGRRLLFAGDVLFYGAVFGLINRPDSCISGYREDLSKLAGLAVDAFLPGHGMFTLSGGQRHIDKAIEQLRSGFLTRQIGQFDLIF